MYENLERNFKLLKLHTGGILDYKKYVELQSINEKYNVNK